MGTFSVKVRILVGAFLLPFCTAVLCPVGQQYWSTESESCVNCSKCDTQARQVVIRPCQGHLDTLCGPISDLNIDWSWLTKKDDKKQKNHHSNHHNKDLHHLDDTSSVLSVDYDNTDDVHKIIGESSDDLIDVGKKLGKKDHKHHDSRFDDILGKVDKHNNKKHHGHVASKLLGDKDLGFAGDKKHHKIHLSSESFVFDDIGSTHHNKKNKHHGKDDEKEFDDDSDDDSDIFDDIERFKHNEKADELEKEWRKWLAESENRLQHRKNDLIKNLREEGKNKKNKEHNKKENHHINADILYNSDEDVTNKKNFDDLNSDVSEKETHSPHRYISKQDLKVFTDFVSEEYKKRKDSGDKRNGEKHEKLSHLKHLPPNDFVFPVDSFDYRSVVPTHRLFLGEPSTVSEMLDQDFLDTEKVSEDTEAKVLSKFKVIPWESDSGLDEKEPSVIAVPFSTAEKFVWDWQAVALTSAVAACLLFFAVVAVYSVLHARQWKRLKSNLDTDVEELSARISLMQAPNLATSAADGSNANHYLENLLAGMKSLDKPPTSNIYIQKHSVG